MDLFSEEYLAHYGVKGMKWGKNIMAKAEELLTGNQYKQQTIEFQKKANDYRERSQWYGGYDYDASGRRKRNYDAAVGYQKMADQARKNYYTKSAAGLAHLPLYAIKKNVKRYVTGEYSKAHAKRAGWDADIHDKAAELDKVYADNNVRSGRLEDRPKNLKSARVYSAKANMARAQVDMYEKQYKTTTLAGIYETSRLKKGLDFIKNLFGN